MTDRKRAAMYARYSSDNQRDESIDAQIAAMEIYAKNHNIEIVATYLDRARSATSDQRPGFQEMIKMSGTGLFDTVMVHKLDRFARSKYDSAIYKQKLKSNRVQLISVTEQLDGSPESLILESVLEAMAEYYSKNLAREVTKGLLENAKSATHTGGVPPLGYDLNSDKKLVINEREAQAVRIIFGMYADGHPYQDIIEVLNQKGFVTRRGNPFVKNSLFEILRNEKYRGVFVYNKTASKTVTGAYNRHAYKPEEETIRVKGGCPAIISDEIFEAVSARQKNNRDKFGENPKRRKYLLSGLVFCGCCHAPMHANKRTARSQSTFRCCQHENPGHSGREVNMVHLESYVLQTLQDNIFSYQRIPAIMELIDRYVGEYKNVKRNQTETILAQLADISLARNHILKAIEDGIAAPHFSERLDDLKAQEERLQAELVLSNQSRDLCYVTEKEIKLLINRFHFMRKEQDLAGLRKIVLDFVKNVTVTDGKIDVALKISFGNVVIDHVPA